jgi:predicted ATP-grasp superfamily ATP-dependent carboligase
VPLLGNSAATVAAVKDPLGFAALLRRLSLPHPETRGQAPRSGAWLIKRQGGAGGAHIAPSAGSATAPPFYAQRRLGGEALSALFVADGSRARVIGLTRQWCHPAAVAPFRYAGAAGPVRLTAPLAAAIAEASTAITAATGLVGLNSLDILHRGEDFDVLEVNPRPGATLDVFSALPLWRWHCAGLAGRLDDVAPASGPPRAAEILYAPTPIVIPPGFSWPSWTADRSPAGTLVAAGEPLCTLFAAGRGIAALRAGLGRRAATLLRRLGAAAAAA